MFEKNTSKSERRKNCSPCDKRSPRVALRKGKSLQLEPRAFSHDNETDKDIRCILIYRVSVKALPSHILGGSEFGVRGRAIYSYWVNQCLFESRACLLETRKSVTIYGVTPGRLVMYDYLRLHSIVAIKWSAGSVIGSSNLGAPINAGQL